MYDELVKRLWECASGECFNCSQYTETTNASVCSKELMKQAADAIEELLQKMQQLPRWIPVTERLPNGEAERYLVAAPLMSLGLRVSICYYADNLEEVDEYNFEGEKHSGFYGYDSEYGHYEWSGVKYWMPLSEPPKEG